MSATPTIPATVRAVVAQPDLSRPRVQSLPFKESDLVKNLSPDHVVVLNQAIGLNPTDYKHAHGDWTAYKSVVLGTESAGVALAVGSNVKHIKKGDRVAGMVYGASSEQQGAASEGLVFDAANLWVVPPGMTDLEAAAFTAGHLTAVQTLYMRWNLAKPSAPVTSKRTILIWGGSTAVGHHAIQLASLSGYRVFATASPANHARLRELGAQECFDYRDRDVVTKIREAAGEDGIFAAYDTAAANGSTDMCIDAIGDKGGRVMSTLPPSPESMNRRPDVQVEFVLVYTLMGYPFKFANAFDFPAIPQDRADSRLWVSEHLPALLEGWQEGGSARYKGQALRVMPGGLDQVYEGINVLGEGAYRAEKLVYQL